MRLFRNRGVDGLALPGEGDHRADGGDGIDRQEHPRRETIFAALGNPSSPLGKVKPLVGEGQTPRRGTLAPP